MIFLRKSQERGYAHHGWLEARHSFSFADYFDPRFMGFRVLRVINEDRVAPGAGFPTHGHKDMEIVTYVLEGELEHRDSLGHGAVIRPGEVQRMTAGSGIRHSEFNASKTAPLHLLQIWLLPSANDFKPSYEQKVLDVTDRPGQLLLIASPDGAEGSVTINQDARIYAARIEPGHLVDVAIRDGRHAWVQVARGSVAMGNHALEQGDGAAVSETPWLSFTTKTSAEILVFDLP
ncbi:MAG: pirin family protein [Alphaproteobacteria bacterium]|nr:pirin family protein [Alphaproteobacteria bacterium]